MEKKIFIKNKSGEKISVLVETPKKESKGLAFILHGLGGYKEQKHIKTYAKSFLKQNITAVRFDARNSFGESDGNYAKGTITNFCEDLETIINWSKKQSWYQEPFWLAGHSSGSIAIALYAQNNLEKVKALAPTSTAISAKLSLQTPKYKNWEEMQKRGWIQEKRGIKLDASHMIDRMKYDLLDNTSKLTMPVLLMTGDMDVGTPPQHQKLLYDKLPGEKELHIIKNAPHTFKKPYHLFKIKKIFTRWIKRHL